MSENQGRLKENPKRSEIRGKTGLTTGPNNTDLWVAVHITAEKCNLRIRNAYKDWGRFHQCGDPNTEILPEEINNIVIDDGDDAYICACGTPGTPSGTDGYFDIYNNKDYVGRYVWDCPASSPKNKSEFHQKSTYYIIVFDPGSISSGPIGNVDIMVRKLDK